MIYGSAKIQEAAIRQHEMEKLDATGADTMFGDDDINFDLQLEKFGVNMGIEGTTSGAYLLFVGGTLGRGGQEKE